MLKHILSFIICHLLYRLSIFSLLPFMKGDRKGEMTITLLYKKCHINDMICAVQWTSNMFFLLFRYLSFYLSLSLSISFLILFHPYCVSMGFFLLFWILAIRNSLLKFLQLEFSIFYNKNQKLVSFHSFKTNFIIKTVDFFF